MKRNQSLDWNHFRCITFSIIFIHYAQCTYSVGNHLFYTYFPFSREEREKITFNNTKHCKNTHDKSSSNDELLVKQPVDSIGKWVNYFGGRMRCSRFNVLNIFAGLHQDSFHTDIHCAADIVIQILQLEHPWRKFALEMRPMGTRWGIQLTSPIMQHSAGATFVGMTHSKKYRLGFPMTTAFFPVEYSKPLVKQPGPMASPSLRL